MHLLRQQKALHAFTKENQIQFESWAPFGEGKRDIFTNPPVKAIGDKYGKTVAQVILRFITKEGVVAIPKSIHPERMAENFAIFDFELSPQDIETLRQMDEEKGLFGWNA